MSVATISRFLRRFHGDRRGVSGVEFAMLAPVMIIMYFGMVTFCMGFMANKRMAHTNAVVADMVAQTASVNIANLDDILSVGGLLMKPFPEESLGLIVTSVTRIDNRNVVDWSRASRDTPRVSGAEFPGIPTGLLIENGTSVVISETTYDYDSPVDMFMPSVTQFDAIHYVQPRLSTTTTCTNCPTT